MLTEGGIVSHRGHGDEAAGRRVTGASRALNPFLHSVLLLFRPQARGLSEGMLEKLDLEDEGKPFKPESYVVLVFNSVYMNEYVFGRSLSTQLFCACHVA